MSNIGTIKRNKMEFKRQQIIERGRKKAAAKAEREKNKGAMEGKHVLLPWSQRKKGMAPMSINVMVDEFDDPTEPLTIYDDYGCGA